MYHIQPKVAVTKLSYIWLTFLRMVFINIFVMKVSFGRELLYYGVSGEGIIILKNFKINN